MTPAAREMVIDTTNKRPRVGDGATGGGIPIPTIADIQKNATTYAAAGGTADALTFAITPVPAAWVAGMTGKFKATATNTTSVTGTITGLAGTKTFKKMTAGAMANLGGGDIFNGGCYDWFYDGTNLVITSTLDQGGGLVSVSQGDLNTSTGTGNFPNYATSGNGAFIFIGTSAIGSSYASYIAKSDDSSATQFTYALANSADLLTLPGGQYGFYPQTRETVSGANTTTSYQQRYVTSSPPYDLGDGVVGGFIFVMVNPAGEVISSYVADVPPWAYNGPTDIRATKKCPVTGKKYRKIMVERSFDEIMDGAAMIYEDQEITNAVKNADMGLIPHPFGNVLPDHTVVLLNPMDNRLSDLLAYQNAGGGEDILSALISGKITVDNIALEGRKGPPGVMQARMKFKYSRK